MIEVSEKDKEQYHNGYELCCWLNYVRPGGKLHDRNKIPAHMNVHAWRGYMASYTMRVTNQEIEMYY